MVPNLNHRNQPVRSRVIVILLVLISFLFLSSQTVPVFAEWMENTDMSDQAEPADRGTVVELVGEGTQSTLFSGGELSTDMQYVRVRVDRGSLAGEVIEARYARTYAFNDKYQVPALRVGDEVMLVLGEDEQGNPVADVADVIRERFLLWMVIAFILVLVGVGGIKGVKAVVSLTLTILSVLFILIPAILRGADPVLVTIGVSMVVTLVTLVMIGGLNRKTIAAFIGTTGGVVAAGLIARGVGLAARLTGIGDEDSQMLMYIPGDFQLDFQGLLFAGILLGALGASMDVAVSMASAMFELREHSPGLPPRGLLKAGMNIGRDTMATMSNTLILAYTGGSLHLLLLLAVFDMPFLDIINRDVIASEVVRALAGSIGLLLTIPVTALTVTALVEQETRHDPATRQD